MVSLTNRSTSLAEFISPELSKKFVKATRVPTFSTEEMRAADSFPPKSLDRFGPRFKMFVGIVL